MPAMIAKETAKVGRPRSRSSRTLNLLGTSSETTSRVIANPKAQSLNPSSREMSLPRSLKGAGRRDFDTSALGASGMAPAKVHEIRDARPRSRVAEGDLLLVTLAG